MRMLPPLFGLLMTFITLPIAILLHEMGHAVGAWASGLKVTEIVVGEKGRVLVRGRIAGTHWVVRRGLWSGGHTRAVKAGGEMSRRERFVMAVGGPLAGAAAGLWTWPYFTDPSYAGRALGAFALVNVVITGGSVLSHDGRTMLAALRGISLETHQPLAEEPTGTAR